MDFWNTLELVLVAAIDLIFTIGFILAMIWILLRTIQGVSNDWKDEYCHKRALATASVMSLVILLLLVAVYSFVTDFLAIVQALSQ